MLCTQGPAEVLSRLRSSTSIRVVLAETPASISAANIIASILHRETIRFEITFGHAPDICDNTEGLCIAIGLSNAEYANSIVLNSRADSTVRSSFECTCSICEMYPCILAYSLAKEANCVSKEAIWPMAVCFEFYRIFTKTNLMHEEHAFEKENKQENNNPERITKRGKSKNLTESIKNNSQEIICNECLSLHADLVIEAEKKRLSTELDGIHYVTRPNILLLNSTSIFCALLNDASFILDNKIYHKDKKAEFARIHEYLARKGISNEIAHEKYTNLSYETKKLVSINFPERMCFIRKIGHNTEISPIESFFLVCYHLLKGSKIEAFLSMSRTNDLQMEESAALHHKLVSMYRECIANAKRIGKVFIFRIHVPRILSSTSIEILLHIYRYYFEMFVAKRHRDANGMIVMMEGCIEGKVAIYTDIYAIMNRWKHAGQTTRYFAIDRNEVSKLVDSLKVDAVY
ncbi:hypothetical protein OCOL_001315 [Ordospora colligata]|uniref:Uncharacterized protein n=1 Tax=Ordospora colligata OC4 TaxID=1354746 RepID=A0A0B2UMI4_9MICR|nr:uncharacterized protein M896_020090 [Ordospora colligata OC4]KHN70175.1 hypothetical protein M896_020090 [Ordospora colligata OC4]TBU16719.1 hypothetical protein CWI41_020100 [Ordospora colligata]TBU17025.1 hypothetical protein CWI40_020100 [Ordospora colligata]